MRYRLRTLMILTAVGPPAIAVLWFYLPLVAVIAFWLVLVVGIVASFRTAS